MSWTNFGYPWGISKEKGVSRLGYPPEFTGAPGGIRTPDLRIRSPALYPAELRAHIHINAKSAFFII